MCSAIKFSLELQMDKRPPYVILRKVSKVYKPQQALFSKKGSMVVALDSIDIEIFDGEIFGLVGESGSGKTTCGRILVRLERPSQGEVMVGGEDVEALRGRSLKAFRRKVQMIFQDPYQSLNPQLTVSQTVAEPLLVQGIGTRRTRERRVMDILKEVGLHPAEDFLFRYPHQLSGGQRQRVAIARSMILEPEFVVADEPVSMLDASIQAQLLNMLVDLREAHNLTLLFITHDLAAARYICNRMAVIYRGRIMERGPAEKVIKDPYHPYTKALLNAVSIPIPLQEKEKPPLRKYKEEMPEEVSGCFFYSRCPFRMGDCEGSVRPDEILVGDGHFVACYLYRGS